MQFLFRSKRVNYLIGICDEPESVYVRDGVLASLCSLSCRAFVLGFALGASALAPAVAPPFGSFGS